MAYKKPSVVPGLWDGVSVAHIENPGLFTVRLTGSEVGTYEHNAVVIMHVIPYV